MALAASTEGKKASTVCKYCGFNCSRLGRKLKHEAAHRSNGRFVCSVCFTRYDDANRRNYHETKAHHFQRIADDKLDETPVTLSLVSI